MQLVAHQPVYLASGSVDKTNSYEENLTEECYLNFVHYNPPSIAILIRII